MKKKYLFSLLISFIILPLVVSSVIALENSAEQYAQSLGIEKSAVKIISRLDKDNQFDEMEKDFITWLASQDKESQFKLAFKYAFDGEISAKEMSEILSTPVSKKDKESEITSGTKSEIEYLMLDDFENKKITEENNWRLGKDIHQIGGAKGKAYIDYKIGVEVNGSSLCIEYNIPEFNLSSGGHGGEVGIGFNIESYKRDILRYDGITFFIKTTDVRKIFTIGMTEEKNEVPENFSKNYLPDITGWKEVVIPFSDLLIHEEHAIDNILELNELVRIGFQVTDLYEDSDRQGKVWIDKIALYKETKKDALENTSINNIKREVIFDFENETRNKYGNWNMNIDNNVCGTGTKQNIHIDSSSGAEGTSSSLCTEIIELPIERDGTEVETHTKLEVKDLDLSQYTGIGFFVKTTCVKKPIILIFIEKLNNKEEEWSIRCKPNHRME